jgi:hypothetical protein
MASRWAPLLIVMYIRPSFWELIGNILYLVDFTRLALGGIYIWLFICHTLGINIVEILFSVYRPNSFMFACKFHGIS